MKESKSSLGFDFIKGFIQENPTFALAIGMCPTLAVTTSVVNGFWMGIAVLFVLTFANVFVSLLRNFIPDEIRIPIFVILIATPVVIVELVMKAYLPAIYEVLGIFVPLIVVNCIIIARAEAFAYRNPVMNSLMDGLGIGAAFTVNLMIVGGIREFLGTGQIVFGSAAFPSVPFFEPAAVMLTPPGGFITLGILMALFNVTIGAKGKTND
ncbi:MAG TPA: electron transport complex subunit E [Bacillota bacterium]|nr:electron transport complex subunit E [Candidatus Fermentithermobacillaceae bacterium]HOB30214.1 electron transport complex subunit E [Bacillota bacterium]HOK64177.1 electron transport complex subunit E [Bacillota bacterium]HOL11686.1 electron transport complex subunit E [Bacillota bacterium]HOQ02814.1 electron transport complex subunit E [Bacillota bacterium]